MNLGQNLRQLRLMKNKTQEEICQVCGFKQGNYTSWETGRYTPTADNLIKLANYFGCSVDYLLGRESEDGVIVVSESNEYTQNEKDLIELFRQLSVRQQYAALGFMKGMLAG